MDTSLSSGVRIPNPLDVLYGHGVSLACARDGHLAAERQHGLFAADTRVLSTYKIAIGGYPWKLLGRSRRGSSEAEWQFQNQAIREPAQEIAPGVIFLSLKRRLAGALHDDLLLTSYAERRLHIRLILHMDADFADIFQVKQQELPPRLNVLRVIDKEGFLLSYRRRGFQRGIRIRFLTSGPPAVFIGTQAIFELDLAPRAEWTCCLEACPVIDNETMAFVGDPHGPIRSAPELEETGPLIVSDSILSDTFRRGRADLRSLTISMPGHPPFIAAGVPWFFTLFGRDQLIAALMTGLDGRWAADGALSSLAPWQARSRDDWHDAEPGKLPHELRRGELAHRGVIPHTPYYGTHDAQALYCLTLWQAWRWTGDRKLLTSYFETARSALSWCEDFGDRDRDGFQEYKTRSSQGYYNQGWKDSGDAILNRDGSIARTPLATVELQGYLFAAYHAMAEIYEEMGDQNEAKRLTESAGLLRARVEEKYWMEREGFYATALDEDKQQVTSISSNSGHLLWSGLPSRKRAELVARRLLEPDMFSGWGLRTLSANNPGYNPLSYQRGSVWPFDTALAAAGLWRYGLRRAASVLIRSVLEAATSFEEERLPELFCGFRSSLGGPVPYEEANYPQAWSSAVPILAAQLFLGILPDAPRGRCYLSPELPDWLSRLELQRLFIGEGEIAISLARKGNETVIEDLTAKGIEVVHGTADGPLWGNPAM